MPRRPLTSPGPTPTTMPSLPRRPPRKLAGAAALLFVGALVAPSLLSRPSRYGRRNLMGSLYSLRNADEYSYLQNLDDVDRTIEERAASNDDPDRCSRVFLYLPDPFADHGHGSQINTYVMAAVTASYLDRALVLVEPPNEASRYAGGSQFGCPVDAFRETMTRTTPRGSAEWHVAEDFPGGFSRLVDHPAWLSRGCDVPCGGRYAYKDWVAMSRWPSGEVECDNGDGTTSNVAVLAGSTMRGHYRDNEVMMARDRPSPTAERWAANLGASPAEAAAFNELKEKEKVWDYVLGLMNRAGFLKLQPWIARDVELFLKSFDLPFDREYDAIHVRRGDKLIKEARAEVQRYWRMQGHTDMEDLPTDYVPFAHYLAQWDGPETCVRNEEGELQVMKHNVYVATDDPVVVRDEIAALPNHVDEFTVLWNDCHELTFYFNPTDDDAFHLNGDGEDGFEEGHEVEGGDSCFGRYHRNVASVADMMILSKARTFIGEYNSNWGRVIRTLRVRLNAPSVQQADEDDTEDGVAVARMARGVEPGGAAPPLTRTLDTRIAWGPTRERSPGY